MISEFTTRGIVAGNPNAEEAAGSKQQFLRLHLPPDTTAILPLAQIAEVLTVPTAQIVLFPIYPLGSWAFITGEARFCGLSISVTRSDRLPYTNKELVALVTQQW